MQVAGVRGRGPGLAGITPKTLFPSRPGATGFEWEIRNTDPLDLFYRRLTSVSDDIESSEPRVDRYTGISELRIQEAQGIEDDSLRAAAYRDVLATINEGLTSSNNNPMAYLHLGIVNYSLKDYVAADLAFDRAEAIVPRLCGRRVWDGRATASTHGPMPINEAVLRLEAQDSEGAVDLL